MGEYAYARAATIGTSNGTLAMSVGTTAFRTEPTLLLPRMAGAMPTSARFTHVSTAYAAATAPNRTRKSLRRAGSTALAASPAATVASTRIDVQVPHLRTGRSVSVRGRSLNRPTAATTAPESGPRTTAAKTQTSEAIVTSTVGVSWMLS